MINHGAGASLSVTDKEGKTPIQLAREAKHEDLAQRLEKSEAVIKNLSSMFAGVRILPVGSDIFE